MNGYYDYSEYNNNYEHSKRTRSRNWLGWVVGIVAVVMLLIIGIPYLAGQGNNLELMDSMNGSQEPQGGAPPRPVPENSETGVEIQDILDAPNDFIGRTVTVRGEVDDVLSGNILRIDQERTIAGDEILVISRSPISERMQNSIFEDNYDVTVKGTVRRATVVEIERDILEMDLEKEVEAEIETREGLVIIVDAIRMADETK